MTRTLMLVASTALSYVGWWLGEGVGLMTAFTLSSLGAIGGLYVGYRMAQWMDS
jgi:hypothetical protein